LALTASSLTHAQAWLPDGVGASWAHGDTTMIYGVEAHWDSPAWMAFTKRIGLESRVTTDLAYWEGRESSPHPHLWEVGVTPVLRWLAPDIANATPFVELGIGVHVLSQQRLNNERNFGSSFQFGEQGGIGIAFGTTTRYELGGYVEHVSNGGLYSANSGITVYGAMFRASVP